MTDQALTRTLSAFAVGEVFLDRAGWRHAAHLFANALAVGMGAAHERQVERLESVARRVGGGTPEASQWGREGQLQAEWSAFLNAYATHLHDYDDAHVSAMIQVGPVVVPVAAALAELRGVSAGHAIEAAFVGAEVAIRVALGLGPRHVERGWHVTGTAGVVGATATAARILGLTAELAEQCLGYGGTQAAGISAQDGTDARALHPAKAALNGIESARLVSAGLDGPRRILEGRRGLLALAADEPHPELVLQGLGREWRALDCHPKRYACDLLAHSAMDAALTLRERIPLDAIAVVEVAVPPLTLASLSTRAPGSPLGAKYSLAHVVALVLARGQAAPESFEAGSFDRAEVVALRDRVTLAADENLGRNAGRVTLMLRDGSRVSESVNAPRGSLSREELTAKIKGLLRERHAEPGATVERLIGLEERERAFNLSMARVLEGI